MKLRSIPVVLIYMGLLSYAVVTLFPLLWMVVTAMKSGRELFRLPPSLIPDLLLAGTPFVNFTAVFEKAGFLGAVINSMVVATLAALGQLITCSMAGFVFANLRTRMFIGIYVLLLSTMFFPTEVTLIPEFLLFRQLGWLDTLLPLIVPSFFVGAFGTLMMTEFFKSIPFEIEEAAILDGASSFGIFKDIYLPFGAPALASLFLVAFIANWDEVLRPVIFNSSPEVRTLPQFLLDFVGQYESQWTVLLAGSFLATLPLILIYIGCQKWVVAGFARSSLK